MLTLMMKTKVAMATTAIRGRLAVVTVTTLSITMARNLRRNRMLMIHVIITQIVLTMQKGETIGQ